MKNEAVKKLSQLIKDRDMEIEALRMKNATLTQVCVNSISFLFRCNFCRFFRPHQRV